MSLQITSLTQSVATGYRLKVIRLPGEKTESFNDLTAVSLDTQLVFSGNVAPTIHNQY